MDWSFLGIFIKEMREMIMKVLVAIDSIKDFENSIEIGNIFKDELSKDVSVMPFLDGGRGTVEAMKELMNGKYQYINVHNPKNDIVTARYVLKEDEAAMEMAESSGLRLLYQDDLDVMNSSSLGFGEMLVDGLDQGARTFFIGIGDTATNDLGMGMLYALGARFYDNEGNELNPVASNMAKVDTINIDNIDHRIYESDITIGTSSDNTLMGDNSFLEERIYRKGATDLDIAYIYRGIENYKPKIEEILGIDDIDLPGLGAGGGVAWALYLFTRAKVSRSMDIILERYDFENLIKAYDVLILGENVNQFDGASSISVAKYAKAYNKNIKIIFLEDRDKKPIGQRDNFDIIHDYQISDKFDRNELKNAIKALSTEINDVLINR